MRLAKLWPSQGAAGLVFLVCAHLAWASEPTAMSATAPAATPAGVTLTLLDHEPAAVRRLLQQASDFEAASDTDHHHWQAATRLCEASRHGSLEAQYRLGMLYAFGKGVPESRALAAALFSQAAAQGHAEAGKMLDSIQLGSGELPTCVTTTALPEKPPPPPPLPAPIHTAAIDRLLLSLPAHKQWVIALTTQMSAWYALDPKLVLSVIAAESNFNQDAQSPKAAMGLMQLIPDTAERFNVRNAYNATQNLRGGMAYLRWLLSYYRGDISYALAAYNAGERRVDRYKGVPPFPETRDYVRKVTTLYGSTRHSFDAGLTAAPAWLVAGRR